MPDLLLRSGELYVEKVRAILDQPFNADVAQHIFPTLNDSDGVMLRRLVYSLLDLIPKLGAFLVDKDNLPDDRTLAASVFTYLIMPFDILSAQQYGLLGYLDDALVAYTLVARMTEPDEAIVVLSAANQSDVAELMTRLPEWFSGAITRFSFQEKQEKSLLQRPESKIPHRRSYELL